MKPHRIGKNVGTRGKALIFFLALSLFLPAGSPGLSEAAEYPTKPVQLVIPYAPGGGADLTGRFVADKVSGLLGKPIVPVNKVGGGGTIAAYSVLAAPPDGYTMLVFQPPQVAAQLTTKGVTFNLLKDFITFNLSVTAPSVIVVKKESPWQTLEDFIADAKMKPGKYTYSTPGYGSTEHFAGEIFKLRTGTNITQVPMDGTATATTAVLGGHINISFPNIGVASKFLQAGSLKALAVNHDKRLKDFPHIPTTVEKGFSDLITSNYGGFSLRVDTPRAIVEKLEKIFREALKDKGLIDNLEKTGFIVENLDIKGAAEFLAKDYQKKSEVAKAINMTPK